MEPKRILALAALLLTPVPAFASLPFTRVALTGDTAPGTDGLTFGQINSQYTIAPQINNNGQVLFTMGVAGNGADTYGDGLWLGRPGNLVPVAHTGTVTRDFLTIENIFGGVINDAGQFAFSCYAIGSGYNGYPIVTGTPGALTSTAKTFTPAPGTNFSYYQFSSLQINNLNDVAFANFHQTQERLEPLETSVFRGTPLNTKVVAFQGQTAPPSLGNQPFTLVNNPQLAPSGVVYFFVSVNHFSQLDGIFAGTGGLLTSVAVVQQPAPGFPNDSFRSFRAMRVDSASEVIFTAATQSGATSVWKYNPQSGLQSLLRNGDPVPNMPGSTWHDFGTPRLTSSGLVVVEGDTGTVKGFWGGTPDNLHLLIQKGGHAPGTPAGVNFVNDLSVERQDLNETGVFVHVGPLNNSTKGAWAADVKSGEVIKVLETGDLFDVGGGDLRKLTKFDVLNDSFLNDANQFAFVASFSDGTSGEFIVTVPEPATPMLLIAVCLFLGTKRRRGPVFEN